jgi:site-specific recombinase XerD
VRWRWLGTNPLEQAEPPAPARTDPRPPTPEQAARIANEAWSDPDWGMLVWLAMMTGARRGELCALAWDRIDFMTAVLTIRSSIAQTGAKTWEKHTKTHQQRRIAFDDGTLALLRAYRQYCAEQAKALGFELPEDARIFSLSPDGSTWLKPDSVGQRYARMCTRLGWDMNLHQLRHYSATELIAAGVDVRTVAGRLGHGGGGSTTLRVYSAWVSEADQRAASTLAGRMPELPAGVNGGQVLVPTQRPVTDESAPYRRIADDIRGALRCGVLRPGDPVPTVADRAARYGVALSTAHRAIAELSADGSVQASRGKRARAAAANSIE